MYQLFYNTVETTSNIVGGGVMAIVVKKSRSVGKIRARHTKL